MRNFRAVLLTLVLALGFFLRIFVSVRLYSGDVNNHIAWGKEIDIAGAAGVYERDFTNKYKVMAPTYPPVALGLFAGAYEVFLQSVRLVYVLGRWSPQMFTDWVVAFGHPNMLPAFLKLPSILADMGIAILLYKIVKLRTKSWNKGFLAFLIVLFSPAIWFNSAAWGQIESIPIFFVILASVFLIEERLLLAGVSLVVAILVKQSAIIFLPLFFVYVYKKRSLGLCFKTGLLQVCIFVVSFFPFEKDFSFIWPFKIFLEKVRTGSGSDYVTDHAFNFWALASGLGKIPDSASGLWGVPYGFLGLLILSIALMRIFLWFWKNISLENLWKAWILISMSTFFLTTRMHERYLAPVFILWLLPWGKWNRLIVLSYIYLSVFHLANLYHNWWMPNIEWVVTILKPELNIKILILLALGFYGVLLVKWTRNEIKN